MNDAFDIITFEDGYIDGPPRTTRINALGRGSKNLRCVAPGRFVPANAAATDSGTAGNHLFLAGDAIGSTSSYQANVVKWKESTYLGAGSGTFAVDSGPSGTLSQNPALISGGSVYPLDLPVPTITAVDPGAVAANGKNINGSVSFRVALLRDTSNDEGAVSEATTVITLNNEGVDLGISYAGSETFTNCRLYATLQGFGAIGPWYWVGDFAIATITAGGYYFGYYDTDLKPLTPDYSLLPTAPDATYIAAQGGHVILIGCYPSSTGHFIVPSKFLKPAQFDANDVVAANPAEPFTGIINTQYDGLIILCQRNAISALVQTGAATIPFICRNIYNLGVSNSNKLDVVDGEFWFWSEQKGLVRSGGSERTDTSWTAPVRAFLEGFSDPIVGYDAYTDSVIVAGNNTVHGGNCYIAYNRGLGADIWDPPVDLVFTPTGKVRFRGRLYLTSGSQRYKIAGTATPGTGTYRSMIRDGGAPARQKTLAGIQFEAEGSVTNAIVVNAYSNTTQATLTTPLTQTDGFTARQRLNVRNVRGYQVQCESANAGAVNKILVDLLVSDALI